jgi:thiol-disulfide isomerase/thioredoxin
MRRILLALGAILLVGCSKPAALPPGSPVQVKVQTGFRAPDVEGVDVATGQPIKLSDLRGQPVLLNFWATTCAPCKMEMPDMDQFYREAGGKLRILSVGQAPYETKEKLAAYAKDRGVTFNVVYDGGKAADQYGIVGLPTSLFIDKDGIIKSIHVGQLSGELMRSLAATAGYK